LLLAVMLIGVSAGAIPAYGTYLPAFYAFVLPIMISYTAWSATQPDPMQQSLALYGVLFTIAIVWLARRGFSSVVLDSLRLRFENLDLLGGLRIEKDRSERANLDKSRFLAAASHDLRQPVHALGMFAGALRARSMDDEARRLVGHIEDSVLALEGLFGSLLDISRLDAGVVERRPSVFPIHPLLTRIAAGYAAQAKQKGLSLRVVGCASFVRTDAVLFERILRNVVDNAVRYTEKGGVLIGCRSAAGGRTLRVQVWDTGPGIPPEHQERVFQEFFQLGNVERDRSKGLGLGLAIVRRLAILLDCPLSLRSALGHGTSLEVSVALAEPEAGRPDGTAAAQGLGLSGLVLVVDDEIAIQHAMRSLLTSWGLTVITAGSEAEMLAQTAGLGAPPSLLICDYRLRGGENGIDVVERLRSEFNEDIPAVLITGDVTPDRLAKARQGEFPLLHKPVPPGRLRAVIGNLIRG
jgi:signal transduction histidine kinase/CheY-like chemotaxis protein